MQLQVLKELDIVPKERFLWLSVEEDCELLTFIESPHHDQDEKLVLKFHRGNAFYEFSHVSEDITGMKEVILMDVVRSCTSIFYNIYNIILFL